MHSFLPCAKSDGHTPCSQAAAPHPHWEIKLAVDSRSPAFAQYTPESEAVGYVVEPFRQLSLAIFGSAETLKLVWLGALGIHAAEAFLIVSTLNPMVRTDGCVEIHGARVASKGEHGDCRVRGQRMGRLSRVEHVAVGPLRDARHEDERVRKGRLDGHGTISRIRFDAQSPCHQVGPRLPPLPTKRILPRTLAY